jgi:hypothetical protein
MHAAGRMAGNAVAVLVLAAGVLVAGAARAQSLDPTARYDIDEALRHHPYDISRLPTKEAAAGRPITFELSVTGTFATNAGASNRNTVATGYATPGFGVGITPVSLGGWDVGAGALIDADYYTGNYDDRFGEGRVEGFAFAEHALGPGTLTGEFIAHSVFTNDFRDHDFRLLISNLNYRVSRGPFTVDFTAEYEGADVPELRRTRLATTAAYTAPSQLLGYAITLEGDVAFSDFNGGLNADRNDTTAALVLIADRTLGRGWSLEWEAAFINRFSNRQASRFTTFDLGLGLAKSF